VSEHKLAAERRTEFGKGAARRIRRAAKVPAVLYGHGTDPVHLSLPGHDAMLALKRANALLELDIEGTAELAMAKHVQRDPIKGSIEHVDLLLVRRGEKVVVDIAVTVTGEAAPDTLVTLEHTSLSVECEATHIPTGLQVPVDGAQPGTQVHAKDVVLPAGVILQTDPEALVVNVTAAQSAAALEAELAEAEAEAGIVHEAPEADVTTETADAAAAEGAGGGSTSEG
jgi:large subunit ribosomal protein L25